DKERQQRLADDLVLTDDQLFQLVDDLLPAVLHLVRKRDVVLLQILHLGCRGQGASSLLRQVSYPPVAPLAEQEGEQQKQNDRHVPQVALLDGRHAAARVFHVVG